MVSEDTQQKIAMVVIMVLMVFCVFAFAMSVITGEDKPVYQEPQQNKDSGGGTNPVLKYYYFKRVAGIK